MERRVDTSLLKALCLFVMVIGVASSRATMMEKSKFKVLSSKFKYHDHAHRRNLLENGLAGTPAMGFVATSFNACFCFFSSNNLKTIWKSCIYLFLLHRWNSWNHYWCSVNETIIKAAGELSHNLYLLLSNKHVHAQSEFLDCTMVLILFYLVWQLTLLSPVGYLSLDMNMLT